MKLDVRSIGSRSAALWLSWCVLTAVPATAEESREVLTDILLRTAESYDKARAQNKEEAAKRAEQEAARAEQQQRDAEKEKAQKQQTDTQRRQAAVAAIKQWPGPGAQRPPLQPGEVYGETENGCGVVLPMNGQKTVKRVKSQSDGTYAKGSDGGIVMEDVTPQKYIADLVWSGACPNGLAHGFGALLPRAQLLSKVDWVSELIDSEQEYAYGRELKTFREPDSQAASMVYRYVDASTHVQIPAWPDPFVPRWGDAYNDEPATRLQVMTSIPSATDGKNDVRIESVTAARFGCMRLTGDKPRGCSYDNDFIVYLIQISTYAGAMKTEETLCPDPRSSTRCGELWQRIAGPYIDRIKATRDAVLAQNAARTSELAKLNTTHVLNWRISDMARQAEAQKAQQQRQAAAHAAEAQVAKEKAAAADAAKKAEEKTQRDFKNKIATLNAGQLYVWADELKVAGKPQQAREVLRAIIARFPNHALAANAAAALTALK